MGFPIASRAFFLFLLWQRFYLSFNGLFQIPESYTSCCLEPDGFELPGACGSFVHKNLVGILVTCEVLFSRNAEIWERTVNSLHSRETGSTCDQSRFQMEPRAGSWPQILGRVSKGRCLVLWVPLCCADSPDLPVLSCPTQQSDDECVLDLDLITDLVLQIDAHGEPGGSCLALSSSFCWGERKVTPPELLQRHHSAEPQCKGSLNSCRYKWSRAMWHKQILSLLLRQGWTPQCPGQLFQGLSVLQHWQPCAAQFPLVLELYPCQNTLSRKVKCLGRR